jgi:hypothetical protein
MNQADAIIIAPNIKKNDFISNLLIELLR